MPKPFKLCSARPLPPDAAIVKRGGKAHVRIRDERGRAILCRLSKDGRSYLRPSKCWYFKYRDRHGTLRRMKGFADLKATEQLAAETDRKASRIRAGVIDPAEEHARRPLAAHLREYAAYLEAKGGTADHVRQTTGRIAALLSGCGFVFPLDADAGKAAEWLNALRRDGAPPELPAADSFTPVQAATLLGISGAAVRAAVKRLNLPAAGNGKARTLPRSTVEALVLNKAKGRGPETVNHYTRAVRGFFRWLVRAKRIGSNPLESLALVNAAVDVRRARRELTADELRRLFDATRASVRTYRGLAGADRYFLYLVAAGTGFRAGALANLTPADFDLDAPTVTLPARFAKNRRTKVQPLPADVAAALRGYLADKPSDAPVWGGRWARDRRGAEMLRIDLEVAGIPYAVEGPNGPEYADFHSLRHSYLTLGGRSGIDLRTLQELAGHSKPELTARYSHRRLYDLAGAVDKLPNLVPTMPTVAEAIPLRLTGTDAAAPYSERGATMNMDLGAVAAVPPGVPSRDIGPHLSAPIRTFGADQGACVDPTQTPEKTGAGADLHRPASIYISEGDGTRTRNHRIDSLIQRRPQSFMPIRLTSQTIGPSRA
jgi:integrase